MDRGIFHKNTGAASSVLLGTRHSFKKSQRQERLVFDFDGAVAPKAYVYAAGHKKKIYLDFFNTSLSKDIKPFGKSHFVKAIDYFPISKEQLSLELAFKSQVTVDIFYLENAGQKGRLVLDIKE